MALFSAATQTETPDGGNCSDQICRGVLNRRVVRPAALPPKIEILRSFSQRLLGMKSRPTEVLK
jgi:hypothetical protein